MAQQFKHKETGDIISLARVRYFIDGRDPVDLSGAYDLSQYVEFRPENSTNDWSTIKAKKSRTDGVGTR